MVFGPARWIILDGTPSLQCDDGSVEKLLLITFGIIALPTIIFCVYLQLRVSDAARSSDHRMGAEAHLLIPIKP
jgi:hypothetical protein